MGGVLVVDYNHFDFHLMDGTNVFSIVFSFSDLGAPYNNGQLYVSIDTEARILIHILFKNDRVITLVQIFETHYIMWYSSQTPYQNHTVQETQKISGVHIVTREPI